MARSSAVSFNSANPTWIQTALNSFWFLGAYTEVTYLSTDIKVVSEKTASRSLVLISPCWPSGHPFKYWPRAALLDFDGHRSYAPTVLPVLVKFRNIFLRCFTNDDLWKQKKLHFLKSLEQIFLFKTMWNTSLRTCPGPSRYRKL